MSKADDDDGHVIHDAALPNHPASVRLVDQLHACEGRKFVCVCGHQFACVCVLAVASTHSSSSAHDKSKTIETRNQPHSRPPHTAQQASSAELNMATSSTASCDVINSQTPSEARMRKPSAGVRAWVTTSGTLETPTWPGGRGFVVCGGGSAGSGLRRCRFRCALCLCVVPLHPPACPPARPPGGPAGRPARGSWPAPAPTRRPATRGGGRRAARSHPPACGVGGRELGQRRNSRKSNDNLLQGARQRR
jgi:hypothetical protein